MTRQFIFFVCIAILNCALAKDGQAEVFGDYVGYATCQPCHGEIVESWKATPHASAFADLKKQGDEKQSVPGCVRCHVVAMDKDGGFIDMDMTPELKDVQCEACHGPGKAHVASQKPSDIVGKPGEPLCRDCHTEGQDKNFDYTVKSKLVHSRQ